MERSSSPAELGDLLRARTLDHLRPLHVASSRSAVRDVALVTDIEEVSTVGPDTVVLLSESMTRGGWILSAALRYAWERRACALIVSEHSATEAVVELARRLGISLLMTDREAKRVTIDLAIELGVARAGTLARLRAATERVAAASGLPSALEELRSELGIAHAGIDTAAAPLSAATDDGDRSAVLVSVELFPGKAATERLSALVPADRADYAEQLLVAAAPTARGLLLQARLEAARRSLPPIALTALTGFDPRDTLDEPAGSIDSDPLVWPIEGDYLVLCLITADRDRVGAAVHQLWNSVFPDLPLAGFANGWLAFVPLPEPASAAELLEGLRRRLPIVRTLELRIGASSAHRGRGQSSIGIREAWMAARMADPRGSERTAVVDYGDTPWRLVGRLLPKDLAEALLSGSHPRLAMDPARAELTDSILAYLDHGGSTTAAARALGVHRNTLQARLRRAEELGIRLGEPDATLPLHLLLAATR